MSNKTKKAINLYSVRVRAYNRDHCTVNASNSLEAHEECRTKYFLVSKDDEYRKVLGTNIIDVVNNTYTMELFLLNEIFMTIESDSTEQADILGFAQQQFIDEYRNLNIYDLNNICPELEKFKNHTDYKIYSLRLESNISKAYEIKNKSKDTINKFENLFLKEHSNNNYSILRSIKFYSEIENKFFIEVYGLHTIDYKIIADKFYHAKLRAIHRFKMLRKDFNVNSIYLINDPQLIR